MAKKYIDADLLREGLEELEAMVDSDQLVGQSMHPYDGGQLHAIKIVKELINSLQQEQPCEDFEKEWDEFENWMESYITSDYPTYYGPKQIAHHFY